MAIDKKTSNCCNPITPETCVVRCPQLVNACCVINEEALDCLFPPIEVTILEATIGYDFFRVDDITGIEVGMTVTSSITGVGAVVVFIQGPGTIQVDIPNIGTAPGPSPIEATFSKVNIKQCDINKAVNDKLCGGGTTPCPTWNVITNYNDPVMDITWQTPEGSQVAVSDPLGCIVRLRGAITSGPINMTVITAVASQLFILPAGTWPSTEKALSVNVLVNGIGGQWTALYVPALLLIGTNGVVRIVFTNFNPNVPIDTGCVPEGCADVMARSRPYWDTDTQMTVGFSLDGLTFNNI